MVSHSCCLNQKLRKGLWSPEEDEKLFNHIIRFGIGCWSSVPKKAGLQRCGKSCRLRWINYLRPDLKRGSFSQDEEDLIISLHQALGNRWSQIATHLPGRTDNEIKNFWNSCLKKKLRQSGLDPATHKPLNQTENDDKDLNSDHMNSTTKPIFDPFPAQDFQQRTVLNTYDQMQTSFIQASELLDCSENFFYGDCSINSINWSCSIDAEMNFSTDSSYCFDITRSDFGGDLL